MKVNRLSYETWFIPTTFVADDGGSVTVRVPNLLFRDWIAKHYSSVIAAALEEVHRSDARVSFIVAGSRDAETRGTCCWPVLMPASIPSTSDSTGSMTNSALSDAMSV